METIISKCCICNGRAETVLELPFEDILGMAHDYTQKVGICRKCGFIFTQNPFSEEKLENRYKHASKFEYDAESHVQEASQEYKELCRRIRHYITDCIGDISSILEIGASSGYNLSLYREPSITARGGVEPSAQNCRLAWENYGIELFQGTFREFARQGVRQTYDLVFLSMILEHIVNPYAFIQQLKPFSKRYLFIEVPVMDIKNADEPFGMMCEEHVNLFTFETLNNLMAAAGYGLADAKIEYGFDKGYPAGWPCIDSIWEYGKKPVSCTPVLPASLILDEYIKTARKLLEQVKAKIEQIPDHMALAVWGTGHHVSMLLKNTSLGKKHIVKFYDSDVRKHGCLMHGVPVMKFSPEDAINSGIEGIVTGTYIFQEAIAKTLQNSDIPCQIYTLYDK